MRYKRIHYPDRIEIFKNKEGLTLIELMIVLVLSLILMAAAYMSYQIQSASSQTQSQVSLMQQDLRVAMFNLSRDIRNAGCETMEGTGSNVIDPLIATSNSSGEHRLTLEMDINGGMGGVPDGHTDDPGEHILYRLNGTDIERIDINDGNKILKLAQNVSTFGLEYLSVDPVTGNITEVSPLAGNEANVRIIRISISIKCLDPSNPDPNHPMTRFLQREIKLRNINQSNI